VKFAASSATVARLLGVVLFLGRVLKGLRRADTIPGIVATVYYTPLLDMRER
jgi:hypothetical protein